MVGTRLTIDGDAFNEVRDRPPCQGTPMARPRLGESARRVMPISRSAQANASSGVEVVEQNVTIDSRRNRRLVAEPVHRPFVADLAGTCRRTGACARQTHSAQNELNLIQSARFFE